MSSTVIAALGFVGVSNLVVTVTAVLAVCWFFKVNFPMSRFNLPPGPAIIPYPFDGLLALFPRKNLCKRVMAYSRRYGDVVSFRIGKSIFVILSSPDVVKELLVKQADVTSNREIIPFFEYFMEYTGGILFSHGDLWQERRRFTLSALRNFGMGKKGIEGPIKNEARIICDTLDHFAATATPLDPSNLLNAAVSNIINGITFGRRLEYDDPDFQDKIERMRAMASGDLPSQRMMFLTRMFPLLLKSPFVRSARENLRGVKDFIAKEVADHDETFDPNDVRDIIDVYLAEVRRLEATGEKPFVTRDNMWTCVFDLFLAGTETTSTTLTWFLLVMAGNPNIQTKVADEIDHVIGRGRAPSVDDRKNMPYTDATLIELLRYRPIFPVGIPHMTARDVDFRGYTIPKDTQLLVNVIGMHHDPKLWDDPEVFNPKRFLSEDGTSVIKKEGFFVFGAGRRVCLGEQLAKMELFLFATFLLQRFTFRLPDDVTPDFSFDHCIRTLAPKQYHMIVQGR